MLALFVIAVLLFLLPVNAGQVQPSSTHDDSSHMITARRSSRTSTSTDEDDEDDQRQGPFCPGAFPFRRPPTPNIPPTSPSVVIKTRTTSAASSDPQPSSPTSPPPEQPPQPHHITSPPQSPPFHVDLPPPPLFHAPPSSPSSSGPQAVTAGMQHYMDTPVLELWDPMDNQGAGHQYEFIGNGQGGTLELDMSGGIIADDMYFDDEGLGTLEKIYLFARSRANFHRQVSSPSACHIQFLIRSAADTDTLLPYICGALFHSPIWVPSRRLSPPSSSSQSLMDDSLFISRSLPNFLPDLTPHEAVEYVLPLLNSLGTDPVDPANPPSNPQTEETEPRPLASVEPEPTLQQPPVPSTSSPTPSLSRSSNIAASAGEDAEEAGASSSSRQTLDHAPLHSFPGDGGDVGDRSAQQQTRSGTSEGYVLGGEEQSSSQAASLTSEPPTASAAPPLSTSTQPTAATSASVDDTTAESRPPHAPTDEPPPLLPVQVFTPLFASLLLSPNNTISDGSRAAVVELLRRLRDGFGLPQPPTGPGPGGTHIPLGPEEREESGIAFPFARFQRKLLERELIMGLAIGMARMDEEGRNFVVLSTDTNGGEDLGFHDLVGEEPIPQVMEDGLGAAGVGQEEQSSSGMEGGSGIGLGLVSPTAQETTAVTPDEPEPEVVTPLFEEEAPRVQLPERGASELRSGMDVSTADEARTSPPIAVVALPTVTSPSPPPPTSAIAQPPDSTTSPRGSPLHLSPTAGRSTSPLPAVAPISAMAHLTHLSPAHSRSGSPARQLQSSPARSAPHTPPSPTMRPVRLPSSESTRSIRIPGTPMEVIDHEDVLGLDTEADLVPTTPPAEILAPVAMTAFAGSLDIPMVPEPIMTPGLEPFFPALPPPAAPPASSSAAETNRDTSAPFGDMQGLAGESIFRRPVLSPVQPPSDHQTPTATQPPAPQRPTPPRSEPSRTTSFSSEKSESTPTEGSSGETVTPSESPAASPTRSRSVEGGPSGRSIGQLQGLESNTPSGPAPAGLDFQSVPLDPPSQGSSAVSPSSTDTSPSTASTQPGVSMETLSSEASTASAGTIGTRSSSSESVPVHTPEGPADEDDAGHIALVERIEELEPGRSADEIGIEDTGDQNPYFMAASTASGESETSAKSADSDTVSPVSGRRLSESPPVQTGSRSSGSRSSGSQPATAESGTSSLEKLEPAVGAEKEGAQVLGSGEGARDEATLAQGDDTPINSKRVPSEGVLATDTSAEVPMVPSASPPPPESSIAEPTTPESEAKPTRPKMGRNRSGSFSAGSSTPFVAPEALQPSIHLRSRSVGRPDFVALPARGGSLDSPYPSPPAQDAYTVPPIDFGALFAAQLGSNTASSGTFSPPPEPAPPADVTTSPVVRLPPTQANNLSPELIEDPGTGAPDASWFQNDNGGTVEEPVEYDTGHDAAVGRVASMSLVAAITAAGILSDETKALFTQEVVLVGRDQVYWVRREAAFALGALAKTVSLELLTSSLLPLYEGMTRDEIANVRQSALFALPGILDRLPVDQRQDLAIKQCAALSHDPDRLVRSALLEIMGEMIYCFRDDDGGPPSQLIELFVGNNEHADDSWVPVQEEHQWGLRGHFVPERRQQQPGASSPPLRSIFEGYNDPNSTQYQGLFGFQSASESLPKARDPERVLICAFNFPAVVAAMGPRRWPELRPYYRDLVRDSATKVRKTLGASIGEIARIIGPDHASRDLVSIWWDLMHDENAEARFKVVDCVAAFVKALGPNDRRNIGVQLEGLWETALTGWRDREALATQFGELSALLTPVGRGGSIKTLLISALTDRTAAVRDAAVSSCPKVMDGLKDDPDVRGTAMRDINALALDTSFRRRATYISAIQTLLLTGYHRDAFEEPEKQRLLATLAEDSVVDVRIGLSRFISQACARYFPEKQTRPVWLKAILRRLGRDPSTEVKSFVASLARPPSSIFVPAASSRPASPTPSPFATFSRPPTSTPLLAESLDDLVKLEDMYSNSPEPSAAALPPAAPETPVTS